jgi:hypothetical protein
VEPHAVPQTLDLAPMELVYLTSTPENAEMWAISDVLHKSSGKGGGNSNSGNSNRIPDGECVACTGNAAST